MHNIRISLVSCGGSKYLCYVKQQTNWMHTKDKQTCREGTWQVKWREKYVRNVMFRKGSEIHLLKTWAVHIQVHFKVHIVWERLVLSEWDLIRSCSFPPLLQHKTENKVHKKNSLNGDLTWIKPVKWYQLTKFAFLESDVIIIIFWKALMHKNKYLLFD